MCMVVSHIYGLFWQWKRRVGQIIFLHIKFSLFMKHMQRVPAYHKIKAENYFIMKSRQFATQTVGSSEEFQRC